MSRLLALVLLTACGGEAPSSCPDTVAQDTAEPAGPVDADGDGYGDDVDCDDESAAIFPGAPELCNGLDDDCDGLVDDEDPDVEADTSWNVDADGDGYGDADSFVSACAQPEGAVDDATDCDDAEASIHPGAAEVCDGLDDDCDDLVDDADPGVVGDGTWYRDLDGDGYGDPDAALSACAQPSGAVLDDTDCDDTDAAIHPDADELCNGVDDDCDGDADSDAVDRLTWYVDGDGDGYGDAAVLACDQPSGTVTDSTDCDDGSADVHPGADERCNDVDDDCDGDVDEDPVDPGTWYADSDGDGYGDPADSVQACDAPVGRVADATDCDDGDAAVSPASTEVCDGVDDDCDGDIDDADAGLDTSTASTWYADTDGDGYGDAGASSLACEQPSSTVTDDTDCDDTDATVHPGATEDCATTADDDCDGSTDAVDAVDCATWYADTDGDGYGDEADSVCRCTADGDYTASVAEDCDDTDSAVNPDATEDCSTAADDDCDGSTDAMGATNCTTFYADADGDGYGDATDTTCACEAPSGAVTDDTDCDDTDTEVNPGQTEVCDDGIDNDCDGAATGCSLSGSYTLTSTADATYVGDDQGDSVGSQVVFAGDVDGDGLDDLLVGAEHETAGGSVDDRGAAYLIAGSSEAPGKVGIDDSSVYRARVLGASADDALGGAVAGLGDLDGDGYDDVGMGAVGFHYTSALESGAVYVFHGPLSGSLSTTDADLQFVDTYNGAELGASFAPLGDLDDDGQIDLGLSAPQYGTGRTYIFYGPLSGFVGLVPSATFADATWTGESSTLDDAGQGLAGVGDVDGDGMDDLLVSAPGYNTSSPKGRVYLIYGPASAGGSLSGADAIISGAAGDELGTTLDRVGDLDGDGLDDVALVAPGEDYSGCSGCGAVYVFQSGLSGSVSLSSADATWYGEAAADSLSVVSGAGDVDGDGNLDLLCGAEGYDTATHNNVGKSYLIYGPFSGSDYLVRADAAWDDSSSNHSGESLDGAGDFNGDGNLDIVIGAPEWSTDRGRAYLVLGTGM